MNRDILARRCGACTRVFIDANIFIYHFSADSRLNSACTGFLASVEQDRLIGITSAAVIHTA